jgi:hypothetical protein
LRKSQPNTDFLRATKTGDCLGEVYTPSPCSDNVSKRAAAFYGYGSVVDHSFEPPKVNLTPLRIANGSAG